MNEAVKRTCVERHDLVWLSPTALASVRLAEHRGCAPIAIERAPARSHLASWVARGHPLIVSRQPEDTPAGFLAVGLALPPREGKHRLPFLVDPRVIVRRDQPPRLDKCQGTLPAGWHTLARALLADPAIDAATPRIIGSAGMQLLTGEPCIGPASDLDLLCTAHNWQDAVQIARALAAIAGVHGTPRLDGELRAPDGRTVAWRELAAQPARLLVKGLRSLVLEDEFRVAALFCTPARVAA
jgi:phosphoribosyl-dephospho-CoA transferase